MHSEMTEADKIEELSRQLTLIERGQATTVFCPWCSTFNSDPASGDCCGAFVHERDARGVRQLQSVERQREGIVNGLRDSIECPYCGGINRAETSAAHPADWKRANVSPYCCDLFEFAVRAIVQRVHVKAKIEAVHRIEDAIAKAERN